jgi:hypothetical protein
MIAFTTAQLRVKPSWARAIVQELERGTAATSGPLALGQHSSPVDWATFYLRYAQFLDVSIRKPVTVAQMPGENCAYQADELYRRRALLSHGFWEVEMNRAILAEGGRMTRVPDAEAVFGPASTFKAACLNRFAHGRHSGADRIRRGERSPWQILSASPVGPLVLVLRAVRRVMRIREHRIRFTVALPWFLVFACSWAAGEAWGAVQGSGIGAMSDLAEVP